jgi:hypothetical protein
MRSAKIVIVLLVVCALLAWVRTGGDFGHIAKVLPFCGGHKPSFYDVGALILIAMAVTALSRRRRSSDDTSTPSSSSDTDADEASEAEGPEEPSDTESQDSPDDSDSE